MSSKFTIDLCSSDEEDSTLSRTKSKPNDDVNNGNEDEDEDEDDDGQVLPNSKESRQDRQRQRRRKSKVVTPDDYSRRLPSSQEESLIQRKQPRILNFLPDEDNSTGPIHEANYFSNTADGPVERSTKKLYDSDSDDSDIPYTRVFGSSRAPSSAVAVEPDEKLLEKPNQKQRLHVNDFVQKKMIVLLDDDDDDDDDDIIPRRSGFSVKQTPIPNPYTKRQELPIASLDNNSTTSKHILVQYPELGTRAGRQYADLRVKYSIALWKYSRTLVWESYNLKKLDSYCRRINKLALSEFPIRSFEEYAGNGIEASTLLASLKEGDVDNIRIPVCRNINREGYYYYSIAEASLAALLKYVENRACRQGENLKADSANARALFLQHKDQWVFLADLIPMIDDHLIPDHSPAQMTQSGEEDNGEVYYTTPSTRSSEYKQLEQLTKAEAGEDMPYIKAHRQNSRVCYELTIRGMQKALYLRTRQLPEPLGYYRTSRLFRTGIEPSFEGVCMVVDQREGGGGTKRLHSMCCELDIRRVPFLVAQLKIGDYAFVSMDNHHRLIPLLIERKSIQDVAASIRDGRWTSQKRRMYQGQYVFGFGNCRMAFIIEGHADQHELTGGMMGRAHDNVSRTQLDMEISNLESEGFEVLRTNNMNGSLAKLVEWTRDVARDYRDGKLEAKYTYDEFMRLVEAVPQNTDFSRIAKDHYTENLAMNVARSGKKRHTEPMSPPPTTKTKTDRRQTPVSSKSCTEKDRNEYKSWKKAQLEQKCEDAGLPKTGNKKELIDRLLRPHPPSIWVQRRSAKLYVPTRHDTCAAAILVALWLNQNINDSNWKGLKKEDIIPLAEKLQVSKEPFTGTGKGRFDYDGWSAMGPLMKGEAPLVVQEKGRFFKLTSIAGAMSGIQLAAAMHDWSHEHGRCRCHDTELSNSA